MHGPNGEPAKGPTANARAWKAPWEKQGQYDRTNPAYDNEFATHIESELQKIKQAEQELSDNELMALLEAISPNNDANSDQEDGAPPPQCPAEEVAEQIRADLQQRLDSGYLSTRRHE